MDKTKVDQFIMVNADKFPDYAQMQIHEKLEKMDESRESMLMAIPWKSPMVTFLLAFFLGILGGRPLLYGSDRIRCCKTSYLWRMRNMVTHRFDHCIWTSQDA